MAKTPKFPNPEFWKAKDNIDWKKQWENLKVCGGIFVEMFKETDWAKVGRDFVESVKSDGLRVADEYKAFMALSPEEKKDRIVNGERSLSILMLNSGKLKITLIGKSRAKTSWSA